MQLPIVKWKSGSLEQSWDWRGKLIRNSKGVRTRGDSGSPRKFYVSSKKKKKKSGEKVGNKIREKSKKKEIRARSLHGANQTNRARCLCHPDFSVQSIFRRNFSSVVTRLVTQLPVNLMNPRRTGNRRNCSFCLWLYSWLHRLVSQRLTFFFALLLVHWKF